MVEWFLIQLTWLGYEPTSVHPPNLVHSQESSGEKDIHFLVARATGPTVLGICSMSTSAGDQCFLCMKTKCQQLSNIVKLLKPLTPYWGGQLEQSSALSFFETSSFVWQVAGWLCRLGWQFWQTSWDIEEHFPTSVLQLNFKWLCPAMSIVKNGTHIICVLYVMYCSYCISSYHAIIQSQRSRPNHSDTTPTTLPEFADFSRMLRFARHFHEDFIMKRHRANPED